MGYEGQKLSDFMEHAKRETTVAAHEMADEGAKRLVSRVKENTPIGENRGAPAEPPGHLRESIKQSAMHVYTEAGDRVYGSGAETDVSYGIYVEEGTGLWGPSHAKYVIRPKNPGGWLSWITPHGFTRRDGTVVAPGTRVFAKEVLHPGSVGAHMFAIGSAIVEHEWRSLIADPALDRWKVRVERF